MANEKRILETKLKNLDSSYKQSQEEIKTLKFTKDKIEGQLKLITEELSLVQKSFDDMSNKKQSEMELLTREINSSVVKDKDLKQRIHLLEREAADIKD